MIIWCVIVKAAVPFIRCGKNISGMLIGGLMISFIAFYSISLGCVVLLFAAEIFLNKIRGRAMTLSLVKFWIYTAIFILRVVPVTKDITLEEIESLWRSKGRKSNREA
ncbi:MAG: D-xylose transporter XylE [bacterium ADurb.Bin478]|nr:MAG: D-xylose transporter XylE [bacterium ADurb.Bin478]